jgi:hypothetical protein
LPLRLGVRTRRSRRAAKACMQAQYRCEERSE